MAANRRLPPPPPGFTEALPGTNAAPPMPPPPTGFTEAVPVAAAPPPPEDPELADGSPPLEVSVTGGNAIPRGDPSYQEYLAKGWKPDQDGTLRAPDVGVGHAALTGVESGALMGWDDEVRAAGGVVGNYLGRTLGMNQSNTGIADTYNRILQDERRTKDVSWDQHPWAYGAGYVPGMVAGGGLGAGLAVQGGNAMANTGRLMALGAGTGAVAGAGESEGGVDRLRGGVTGAAAGAALAPVAQAGTRLAGTLFSRLGEATGISNAISGIRGNALNTGLDVLSRRAPQNADDMATRVATMRANGVEPALVDAVDESGRGVMRAAVGKAGPAREEAARAADTVYTDSQDRVADAARGVMGNERLTSRQIASHITEERNQIMGPAMDPHRATPVPVTPELAQTLATPEGQRALIVARGYLQPNERDQVNAVLRAARDGSFEARYSPEAQRLIDAIPQNMGAQARQAIIAQIEQMHPAPPAATLTVDIADKFARALSKKAQGNDNGLGRVASSMANTVRDAARLASPEYGQALDNYAARSRVADAAGGTGAYADNSDFLRTPVDTFTDTVAGAGRTRPVVSSGEAVPTYTPEQAERATQVWTGADDNDVAEAIGRKLRSGEALSSDEQATLGAINQVIDNGRVPKSTLHRGTLFNSMDEAQAAVNAAESRGPISFSRDRQSAEDYFGNPVGPRADDMEMATGARPGVGVVYETRYPGGRGAEVSGRWDDEAETLLPAGRFTNQQVEVVRPEGHPQGGLLRVINTYEPNPLTPTQTQQTTLPSELDAVRVRARDAVVDQATKSPAAAQATAKNLSVGSAARDRANALLGPEASARLRGRMGAEVDRVRNTAYIDERIGSKTAGALGDAVDNEIINLIPNAMTGGKWGIVKGVTTFLRRQNVRGIDAERLTRDAISRDPARVDEAIAYLTRKGLAATQARTLVRSIAVTGQARAVGAQQ